jgi:hypothetical protein
MKTVNLFLLIIFIILSNSCNKTDRLKRKLKGKYTIEKFTSFGEVTCNSSNIGPFTRFDISNPGKIEFTGKKTIQGGAGDPKPTYVGYLDYKYDITDLYGNQLKQTEKKIFKYAVQEQVYNATDSDSVRIEIIFEFNSYDLMIEKDDKGKITKFLYKVNGDNCGNIYEEHWVE